MRTSDELQEKGWESRRGVSLGEAPHVPQPDPDLRLSVLANGIVPITRGPPGKKDKERDKDSLPEIGDATKAGRDLDQSVAAVPALVSLLYTSKNWLERRNGLITLSDLVVSKCSSLQSAGRLEEVLDAIFSRVEDGHAKVCVQSAVCMHSIQVASPPLMTAHIRRALPWLLSAQSSAVKQVSTIGGTILWAVLESSPLAVVLPNLCNVASFEKDRLRAIAFRVLGLYCTRYLEGQVTAVKRSAFPTVCQALCTASLKPDVRVAAIESLRLIQTMTRDSVWCWTENQLHQQELKRILI
eukprot:gene3810-4761_t